LNHSTTGATRERVLVVDDEPDIRDSIAWRLGADGYHLATAADGVTAIEQLSGFMPDVVLLDMKLPDMDGIEVLRRVRQSDEQTLVVLFSGQADETDRILALEIGADAFLQKPCGPREVSACIRSLLRRRGLSPGPRTKHASGLIVDDEARTVRLNGEVIDLTPTEFDLLAFFSASSGAAFARHELLENVWRLPGARPSEATVTEVIRRLRRKLEPTPAAHRWIVTVHGYGYAFRPLPGPESELYG